MGKPMQLVIKGLTRSHWGQAIWHGS